MSEWVSIKLRELIGGPISGSRPAGGANADTQGIPSLGGENILSEGGVTYANLNRVPDAFYSAMPKGRLQPLDVLINKDGAQTGKVGFYKGEFLDACVNEHLFIMRNLNGSIDQQFMFYAVLLPETQTKIARRITGSAQPGLNTTFVDAVDILLPSNLGEQRRIAEILSTLDEAIEQTEALIAKHHQIKAALMHDLFTRGVTPDGRLRPTRDQAPELYKESPLGWIPNEWGVANLGDRAQSGKHHLKTGPFGSSLKIEHWVEEGQPVITIGALGEGAFLHSELLFVSDATARRLREYQLEIGDIVFSRVADVGRSAVIFEPHKGWIMSSNLMRISLDPAKVRPEYLQAQLAYDPRVRFQIRATVNTGGRDVANSHILNRLVFAWPQPAEQLRTIQRVKALDAKRQAEMMYCTNLRKQKHGLMHDLLTGRVRVKVAEPAELSAAGRPA